MRALRYLLINGLFAVALYFGFVEGVVGAYNIAMVMAWLAIVVSWFAPLESFAEANANTIRSVPSWLDTLFDLSVVAVLSWYGAMVTAAFYLLHYFLVQTMWKNIEELRKASKED